MIRLSSIQIPIFLFFLIRFSLATGERMFAPLLSAIALGLQVNIQQITLALSLSFLISASGPLMAVVLNPLGRKSGTLIGVAIFALGSGLIAWSQNFPVFVLGVLLMGIAHSIIIPTVMAYISERIPYQKRGTYLSMVETSWALSFIFGIPVMAFVVEIYNWKMPFLLLTLASAILFLLVAFIVPGDTDLKRGNSPFPVQFKNLLRNTPVMAALIIGFSFGLSEQSINIILGVWMENSFNLAILAIGGVAALIGIAQLAGEILSAGLVDRVGKVRSTSIGLFLNLFFLLQYFWLGKTFEGALIWLVLSFITFEFFFVCSLSLISELVPEARTTLAAAYIMSVSFGFAGGAILGPYLYSLGMGYVAIASALFSGLAFFALRSIMAPRMIPENI